MSLRALVALALVIGMAIACGHDDALGRSDDLADSGAAPVDQGPLTDEGTATVDMGCPDTDGDGIADRWDSGADDDGDGIPNREDLDSDGDGIPDREEAGVDGELAECFPPVDTDGNGLPDFRDTDSDGDGLSDAMEVAAGTDPRSVDSDGDGCPDPAELTPELCQGPLNVTIDVACATGASATALFVWEGPEVLPEAFLQVTPEPLDSGWISVGAFAESVVPAGAATLTAFRFEDVQPGAALGFRVQVSQASGLVEPVMLTGTLEVLDGEGTVLASGTLFLFGERPCSPVLI